MAARRLLPQATLGWEEGRAPEPPDGSWLEVAQGRRAQGCWRLPAGQGGECSEVEVRSKKESPRAAAPVGTLRVLGASVVQELSDESLLAGNRERGGAQRTVRAGTDPLADELYNDDDFDVVDVVRAVAAERALPPAQVALAWLLGKPAVTAPVVGATKLRHLEDAIAAVDVTLSEDEVARLEAPYRPHPVLGHH